MHLVADLQLRYEWHLMHLDGYTWAPVIAGLHLNLRAWRELSLVPLEEWDEPASCQL